MTAVAIAAGWLVTSLVFAAAIARLQTAARRPRRDHLDIELRQLLEGHDQ